MTTVAGEKGPAQGIVGDSAKMGEVGTMLILPTKDSVLAPHTTHGTDTVNGTTTTTTTTTTVPPTQSPDSAIGGTPPTSTPETEHSTTTTTTTMSAAAMACTSDRQNGLGTAEAKGASSSEEGYEEDDEGEEEEQLTGGEEEEEEEEQQQQQQLTGGEQEEEEEVVLSASMQFPLGSKASPSGCESDIEDNCEEEEEEEEEDRSMQGGDKEEEEEEQESKVNRQQQGRSSPPTPPVTTPPKTAPASSPAAPSPTPAPGDPSGTVVHLPDTVTRLDTPGGSAVYLVGTAHFSRESQEDVANTIRTVQPDVVVVELCKARTAILQLDEETILQESRSLDLKKVKMIMREHGKIQGVLYLLLLSVSAHITKQLGMAPGGEFRTAFAEARRSAPNCVIQLGDRPIQVTLSRALASLSLWHKIKLTWHILTSKEPISKEEVEKCKQRDFILEMLAEMTGQFPAISEVFVKERDIYLCRSLQAAARTPPGSAPRVVVGVVGIGHVPGIVQRWGTVTDEDIAPIMRIPPPSVSSLVLKISAKAALYGLLGYGAYRLLLPRPAQSAIRSSLHSTLSSATASVTSSVSSVAELLLLPWRK